MNHTGRNRRHRRQLSWLAGWLAVAVTDARQWTPPARLPRSHSPKQRAKQRLPAASPETDAHPRPMTLPSTQPQGKNTGPPRNPSLLSPAAMQLCHATICVPAIDVTQPAVCHAASRAGECVSSEQIRHTSICVPCPTHHWAPIKSTGTPRGAPAMASCNQQHKYCMG